VVSSVIFSFTSQTTDLLSFTGLNVKLVAPDFEMITRRALQPALDKPVI
jgi:hypothetical protein